MPTINATHQFYDNDDPTLANNSIEIDRDNSQIILGKNLTTTPQYIYISPNSISNGSASTSFTQISNLSNALASVELPPNPNTLQLNNTLLLTDGTSTYNTLNNTSITLTDPNSITSIFNTNLSITDQPIYGTRNMNLDAGSLTIGDGIILTTYIDAGSLTLTNLGSSFSPQILLYGSNTLALNSNDGNTILGDTNNNYNKTNILINDTHREIDLNAVDIISNCGGGNYYTLPIQFTNKATGNYNYTLNNNWEMVYSTNMNIPLEELTLTNGRTTWKLDFAINCFNMTFQTDKAYAMYIEIRDVNGTGNDYTGFLFNQNTPYTTHKNASTYNNTTNNVENYIYTDYIDLNGATGSPLEIRLWRYADNNMSCDFNWLLTLSKNNLV